MWTSHGKARKGVGLHLARTFHSWLITQQFRFYSFYCRSGRNVTAGLLSRASSEELEVWDTEHRMKRIDPRKA